MSLEQKLIQMIKLTEKDIESFNLEYTRTDEGKNGLLHSYRRGNEIYVFRELKGINNNLNEYIGMFKLEGKR